MNQIQNNNHNPRKLLITTPNQKNPNPNTTTSSPDSSDSSPKKTRNLPNLSDCHSCNKHTNPTNPKNRLQPLDSIWRIVLLCRKCTSLIKSNTICTYCFRSVNDNGSNDSVKCAKCDHSMHRECVGLGPGLGFAECVDCWVPDAVARSVVCAVRASENAVRKASVAKSKAELAKSKVVMAKSAMDVVGGKGEGKGDVELAIMLHKAINCSPRIGRYGCLMSLVRGEEGEMACYSRRKGKKNGSVICYTRRCGKEKVKAKAPLMCYSRKRLGSNEIDTGLKGSNCGSNSENCINDECVEIDGERIDMERDPCLLKYQRIGKGTPRPSVFVRDSDCGSCTDFSDMKTEDTSDTRDIGSGNECYEVSDKCDDNGDRFLLKYKRLKLKGGFSCKSEEISSL
ncbi:hypothetical protein CTI12_AA487650 [Artemisia annua]|uniref:Uncharacterized protein n=1 Tax=Artemisia annua TaxID=35608 RepID=A0A2U1LIF6_ARTAN|nr:hypothetical protein CTI12_AA487650 [Artemisia annua]